jgi:hypothetical protein
MKVFWLDRGGGNGDSVVVPRVRWAARGLEGLEGLEEGVVETGEKRERG